MIVDKPEIGRHIDPVPEWRPADEEWPAGPTDAYLRDSGVPVWALVSRLRGAGGDRERVVKEYRIASSELEEALLYYEQHKLQIDARIQRNSA